MAIYFDDSLPTLAKVVTEHLGKEALAMGVVIRDTSGQLCFFSHEALAEETKKKLAVNLIASLEAYARTDRVLGDPSDFGVQEALESPEKVTVISTGSPIQLIDNRLVGADWLRTPTAARDQPPRFVFASLKGGVGRSTALSVVAADAASRGKRVLAVDLDLEAPGLGSILLSEQTTPIFGMIDALVEIGLAPPSPQFFGDLVGPSSLTDRGRIDVLPAFGRRSLENPGDVLSKIARAYSEIVTPEGGVKTLFDQVSEILDNVIARENYDLVLIDARAGLHETAASALLGLGAELFCFGIDEPQTFSGYQALFAHMRGYSRTAHATADWLSRVNIVQAKAPLDQDLRADFTRRSNTLVAGGASRTQQVVQIPDGFSDIQWNEAITDEELGLDTALESDSGLAILYDENFRNFHPMEKRDQISESVYRNTFGNLIEYIQSSLHNNVTTQ